MLWLCFWGKLLYPFFVGFLLEKKIGVNQPKKIENARILIANTAMDTDKIKVRLDEWMDG